MSSIKAIQDLFPAPSAPPGRLIPRNLPGVNPDSVGALLDVLKDNHTRWDIFFNERGFHNHSAHRAIAIWALGAPGNAIKAGYKYDEDMQRPARVSPVEVSDDNWKEHTGDHINYQAFLKFFTDKIRDQGIASVLEQYIFSKDANTPAKEGGHNPAMLDRFLGGLVHPMIHIGYGLEFRLPGMVAEGLAQAAVHRDTSLAHVAAVTLNQDSKTSGVGDTISRLASLAVGSDTATTTTGSKSSHVFDLLARVSKDADLVKIAEKELDNTFSVVMQKYGSKLAKYAEDWTFEPGLRDLDSKIAELSWLNALVYGIGGWGKADHFTADFFLMHLVTSSLFLASYCAYLKPESQALLLRSYLLVSLGYTVGRGLPSLEIERFFESTTSRPSPVEGSALPTPSSDALLSKEAPAYAVTPNPWLPLIETSIVDPNDHLPKLVRALAHYDALYGGRQAGEADFKNTELPGAERLDGTLFLRAAGLTLERLGRVREGQKSKEAWDRNGFYKIQ